MAIKQIRIGSMEDVHQYDDGDFSKSMAVEDPITCSGIPVDPDDLIKLSNLSGLWPIGSVFLSVVSTNPNTLLGFGTWSRIADGQFLVGFKTADADFDPVENTGGSKTHTHDVDVANTTSGVPSGTTEVDNNLDISTVNVGSDIHTHDVNPATVTSGDNNNLPPFFVIYIWKRTA